MVPIKNFVFAGGGVLGVSYLGLWQYLSEHKLNSHLQRVAGTSAGAITACITSFQLPFEEMVNMVNSLDYQKIPDLGGRDVARYMPRKVRSELEKVLGDLNGIYRLVTEYGFYSTEYFHDWIETQINSRFDAKLKPPPYTFEDFRNPMIHKNKTPFLDLYLIGTNISMNETCIFSYDTTPTMTVAEAVTISMCIPLYFGSIKITDATITGNNAMNVFSDGGVIRNYPINLFDEMDNIQPLVPNLEYLTIGARFKKKLEYNPIHNFIDYVSNLLESFSQVQDQLFYSNPVDIERSIEIDTKDISPLNFSITPGDPTYTFLYQAGYNAAKEYFDHRKNIFG